MTDLHTHILPGMDDGARDVETSLAMLRLEWEQGVDGVALTPHFYRERERADRFFARRQQAWERLSEEMAHCGDPLPSLVLGAEVAWVPNLNEWDDLERFCLGESRYFLLELPFTPWSNRMIDQLYDLMSSTGVTPVLAHLERYFKLQKKDHLREIAGMGLPVQLSAQPLLHLMERGPVLREIRDNGRCFLASDCHGLQQRRPDLGPGMEQAEKRLGPDRAALLRANSRGIFDLAASKGERYAAK